MEIIDFRVTLVQTLEEFQQQFCLEIWFQIDGNNLLI